MLLSPSKVNAPTQIEIFRSITDNEPISKILPPTRYLAYSYLNEQEVKTYLTFYCQSVLLVDKVRSDPANPKIFDSLLETLEKIYQLYARASFRAYDSWDLQDIARARIKDAEERKDWKNVQKWEEVLGKAVKISQFVKMMKIERRVPKIFPPIIKEDRRNSRRWTFEDETVEKFTKAIY